MEKWLIMYKIKNISVDFIFENKNGKVIKKIEYKNKLLQNYTDFVGYSLLPQTIGNVLYPKFIGTTGDFSTNYGMARGFIKFNTTQTINDSSTTMNYDIKSLNTYDIPGSAEGEFREEVSEQGKDLFYEYFFDFSSYSGQQLFGLGFGKDDTLISDYLFSFLDLENLNLEWNEELFLRVVRHDRIVTNEIVLGGGTARHLPSVTQRGEITKIATCKTNDGQVVIEEKNIGDLTVVLNGGIIEITGFNPIEYSDELLPSLSLFPSETLFPVKECLCPGSIKFTYNLGSTTMETYLPLKELGLAYDGKDLTIKLKIERNDI